MCLSSFFSYSFRYLDIFIEKVLGWNVKCNCPTDIGGIFGKLIAFFAAIEEQDRKALHAHFCLWIAGVEKLLEDFENLIEGAKERLEQYIDSIMTAKVQLPFQEVAEIQSNLKLNSEGSLIYHSHHLSYPFFFFLSSSLSELTYLIDSLSNLSEDQILRLRVALSDETVAFANLTPIPGRYAYLRRKPSPSAKKDPDPALFESESGDQLGANKIIDLALEVARILKNENLPITKDDINRWKMNGVEIDEEFELAFLQKTASVFHDPNHRYF